MKAHLCMDLSGTAILMEESSDGLVFSPKTDFFFPVCVIWTWVLIEGEGDGVVLPPAVPLLSPVEHTTLQ